MMEQQIKFLVIEDNELDVEKIRRSIKKLALDNPLIRARDGVEALEILRGQNGKVKLRDPYIILLDLNMPRMSGLEFLAQLRRDKQLKNAYVYVLTTSDRRKDIDATHQYNVAGYMVKDITKKTVIHTFEVTLEHILTSFKGFYTQQEL
jgi:CheY-like chemotaxis protein